MKRRCRTRIIATLGPSSSSETKIRQLIGAGADVFRLNFSHGTHDEHRLTAGRIRKVARALDAPVAILQDLSGPKLRVGELSDDGVLGLLVGETVAVVEGKRGKTGQIPIPIRGLVSKLKKRQQLLFQDGLIEVEVLQRRNGGIVGRVVHGGLLRSRQGMHIPGVDLGVAAFTAKDKRDLDFGLSLGVDAVALSFVRDANDIRKVWRFVGKRNRHPFVIAKIERAEAMDHLDEILKVCRGVMVARGDLGVELGYSAVPLAQKRIVALARRSHRPVITATQMLESMIERPTATRAEISDVANAVLEGTDALMLSGETAVGKYPVEAVKTLEAVARRVETERPPPLEMSEGVEPDPAAAVARAAGVAARATDAQAIVVLTVSGRSARLVSAMRPRRPIIAVTASEKTWRRTSLMWGVTPVLLRGSRSMEGMVKATRKRLLEDGLVHPGKPVVAVFGDELGSEGATTVKVVDLG